MRERLAKASNKFLSLCAGAASFIFTLTAILMLKELPGQVTASIVMGLFALLVVWLAFEKPNSKQTRVANALIERLLAVKAGDLNSPAPMIVRREMPALASAVDGLFAQVRSNLDTVHALALFDPVTSLPNRIHFKREAEQMLADRHADAQMALLFIDLDGFKEVNDSLGHAQGDHVLTMVANRLRIVAKAEMKHGSLSQPLLARLAGDEFTMLFPAIRDPRDAERIARRALMALAEPFELAGRTINLGASIGISLCPRDGGDLTSLMKAADIAMYQAKASGRSQTCLYHPRLAAVIESRSTVERELREGLASGAFELAYQPQLCARTGAVVAGEALIRWNHPSGEIRLPDSFIPIAEQGNLIIEIGDWVIEEAAATLARWHRAGLRQRLAFNVSPRQLDRPDFFRRLRKALTQARAPLWLLEIEITETVAMRCSDAVIAGLSSLRAEGVSIAIDDFGSGYSNLARLKDMPIDRVKLDRTLIQDVDTSESARTIVTAVIHLIHGLGCEVVAEGIERDEQLGVLRAIGCDTLQGFAFTQAISEPDFLDWLRLREAGRELPRVEAS